MRKWNKIKLAFFPPLSAEGNWSEFHEAELILWCVVGWRWKARSVNVLGGKVAKKRAIRSQEKFEQWCKIGVGSANKEAFDLFCIYLFIYNSTVLGLDFQTDIEFVPEW